MHLAGTICQGASHTHLNELLSEREGIHIGRTTLRRILADAGMAVREAGVRPSTGCAVNEWPGKEC